MLHICPTHSCGFQCNETEISSSGLQLLPNSSVGCNVITIMACRVLHQHSCFPYHMHIYLWKALLLFLRLIAQSSSSSMTRAHISMPILPSNFHVVLECRLGIHSCNSCVCSFHSWKAHSYCCSIQWTCFCHSWSSVPNKSTSFAWHGVPVCVLIVLLLINCCQNWSLQSLSLAGIKMIVWLLYLFVCLFLLHWWKVFLMEKYFCKLLLHSCGANRLYL